MKTVFKLEKVMTDIRYNRHETVNAYRAVQDMRKAATQYIRYEKTQRVPTELREYMQRNVKHLKEEFHKHVNRHAVKMVIVRVGRPYEIASEITITFPTKDQRRSLLNRLNNRIKDIRRRARDRHDPLVDRPVNGILRRYESIILDRTKKPTDMAEYVGIEIECVIPSDASMGALLPFAKWVNVGTDGSINHDNNEDGKEIRVCVKREEVRAVVPGIMDALNSMGAIVNKSCGLHVHLDQRNNPTPELTFQKLVRSLGLLYTVIPKSRRENTYCKRNRRTSFQTSDRYKAINSLAFQRYKTLEIRLFGGTLNADKVINWIETLEAIAHGEMVNRCPKNFDTARKYWSGLTDANIAWLKARQIQFAPLNETAPTAESDADMRTASGLAFAAREEDGEDSITCPECGEYEDDCVCEIPAVQNGGR